MGLKVISPGALTSIQDEGRFGHQRIGMSPAGAMDLHALRLANILVDNERFGQIYGNVLPRRGAERALYSGL